MGKSREQKDNTELCRPDELPVRYYSPFDMRIILGVTISVLILSTYYINSLDKVYEGSAIFKLATYRNTCDNKGKEINITNSDSLRSVIQQNFGEENLSVAPLLSRLENFDWVNLNSGLIKVTILKNSIESVEKNLNIISDYFMEHNSSALNQFEKQAQRNDDLISYIKPYNSGNLSNPLKMWEGFNDFKLLPENIFPRTNEYLKLLKQKALKEGQTLNILIHACNNFDIRNGQKLTGNVIKRADTWEKKSLFILVSVFFAFIFSNFLVLIIKYIREDKKFITQEN